GGLAARLFGRSTGLAFAIFARVTGLDMFGDLSSFFRSMSGVIDGFSERTRRVASLLRDPATTFMIVTSPEHEAAREAVFLADRLRAAGGGGAPVPLSAEPPRSAPRRSLAQRPAAAGRAPPAQLASSALPPPSRASVLWSSSSESASADSASSDSPVSDSPACASGG